MHPEKLSVAITHSKATADDFTVDIDWATDLRGLKCALRPAVIRRLSHRHDIVMTAARRALLTTRLDIRDGKIAITCPSARYLRREYPRWNGKERDMTDSLVRRVPPSAISAGLLVP